MAEEQAVPAGGYAIMAELRFDNETERDSAYSILSGLGSKIKNSQFSKHLCNHGEDGNSPCTPQETITVDKNGVHDVVNHEE